jgi:hypothetical protein
MRPFPHDDPGRLPKTNAERARFAALPLLILATTWIQGCAGLGSAFGTSTPTPTPPSTPPFGSVAVTVTPASATVILGNPQMFTATVTNASDTTVVWNVNGVAGGNAATGTISTAGVYTAPAELPASPAVQIAATSTADATKSGTSQVAIASDLQIALSATGASVELGAKQAFHALITSSGNPTGGVTWTLSGAALWGQPREPYRVLGWSQGTFRIARNGVTGMESVTQDSAAASVFDPQRREFRREGIRNLPVAIFQLRLRKALEEKN